MSTIIYLRCGVQLQIDRPYQTKAREAKLSRRKSPATTKSFQLEKYHTAARSLLKCDRAYFCETPLEVAITTLTCYR